MKNIYNAHNQLLLIIVLQCLPFFLQGSIITFQQIYQCQFDQSSRDVIETSDGGYLIAGMTENQIPGDTNIYILKTNNLGDTLWTKTYGGSKPEYPNSILKTNDGSYFILGYTASYGGGSYDSWLLKINTSGDTLWTKTYGGSGDDVGKEIISTSDGNYIIVGRSNSPGNSYYDAFLIKIDPSGNIIWTKNYGGPQYETARSVKQCTDGGFILTGQTLSYGQGAGDIYLIKTNSTGDTSWTKTYGGTAIDDGNAVLANSDGSYIICAETNSFGAGDMDVQVIKTDENGNVIWNKTYGGTQKDVSKTICSTTDGGYFIGAISRSFGWTYPDMWLIKIDGVGDTMWTRHYGISWEHEHCHTARQTADGGYIAVGHSRSYGPIIKIMFIKLDQLGTFGTAAIDELTFNSGFDIYPNPSDGSIKIEWNKDFSSTASGILKISNLLGEVIFSENIDSSNQSNNKNIDLKDTEAGIYFLTIQSKTHLATKKFILK